MFRDKFVALRKGLGLSQVKFAELLGISRSTVGMYELGAREPNFEQVNEIAKRLGVSVADLIDDTANEETAVQTAKEKWEEAELAQYLELLRSRPEMKVLLDTVKGATKEEVEANVKFIEAMRKGHS